MEFYGWRALMKIDLIDQITDYIKIQCFIKNHKWFANYRINFSTNGIYYNNPKVQRYIAKW